MKIGIMSMQRVINYGSYLQAYGLKKTLEEFGHSVEFVDYKIERSLVDTSKESNGHFVKKVINLVKMLSPSYRRWRKQQIRANQSFEDFCQVFTRNYLPEIGVTEVKNECPELDVLVIGSDEVFNCTQSGNMVGYSCQLFGAEHRADKLISYAASFGSTTLAKLEEYGIDNEIRECLSKFDALSLRDQNSLYVVKSLCGIKAQYHIDPVLLYSFPEVEKIQVPIKDYIIVYAYAGRITDEEARVIRKFARKRGKKLICLGFWQTFCDDFILATPLETLAYIREADYVITDTFHGTVFSIKYQKQFGTIIRESNRQKLSDLLIQFGLESHQIQRINELSQVLEQDIELKNIQNCIQEKRNEAKQYLRNELVKKMGRSNGTN